MKELNILSQEIRKNMILVEGGKYNLDTKEVVEPSLKTSSNNLSSLLFENIIEVSSLEVSKYPITNSLWNTLMEKKISEEEDEAVEWITWWEAIEFCNRLSKANGYEPVYILEYDENKEPYSLRVNQLGEEGVSPEKADFRKTNGYRLPIEIEWEWIKAKEVCEYTEHKWEWCYDVSNKRHLSTDKPYAYGNPMNRRILKGGYDDISSRIDFMANDGDKDFIFRIVRTV